MEHLFRHLAEVERKVKTGDDDGTPVYSDEVVWSGSGLLDSPRQISDSTTKDGPSDRVLLTAKFFAPASCPANKHDQLYVTDDTGRFAWEVIEVAPVMTPAGLHHLELDLERLTD